MTKGRQSTQVRTRPRAAFQSRFSMFDNISHLMISFSNHRGQHVPKVTHMRTCLVFGDFWSPHTSFSSLLAYQKYYCSILFIFLNICSWSGDVEVNAKACQFDTWRPMCDITHFGRINVGKNTCGKIGEEVLMRSFSLGSHRSSQPSSTRNSWLFGYVNRGRDFLEEFSTIGKGRLWGMISIWCMNHRAAKFTKNKNDQWNHAGGFATNISTRLSLKMQPQRDWLTCGARCVGSEPPKMPTAGRQWHSEG